MNSYQRLKRENEALRWDIAILVLYPGSIAAEEVSEQYRSKPGFRKFFSSGIIPHFLAMRDEDPEPSCAINQETLGEWLDDIIKHGWDEKQKP